MLENARSGCKLAASPLAAPSWRTLLLLILYCVLLSDKVRLLHNQQPNQLMKRAVQLKDVLHQERHHDDATATLDPCVTAQVDSHQQSPALHVVGGNLQIKCMTFVTCMH